MFGIYHSPYHYRCGDFAVEIHRALGADRQELERALIQSHASIPLSHRYAWALVNTRSLSWFIAVKESDGRCCLGCGIDVTRSRALPGHLVLRVEKFGSPNSNDTDLCLRALADYARSHSRILRIHLEVFSRDPSIRKRIGCTASDLGFRRSIKNRLYTTTVVVDLVPDETEIFASLHPTARRHIRCVGKHPVALGVITDRSYAQRLSSLLREAIARTGGRTPSYDWATIIGFSNRHPELSRLVGLYRTDRTGPESLLAYAWGRVHGDHADYAAAASTRQMDFKMPLGYALAWDLICWAKMRGATWFDFGGITPGHFGKADPLGGISDFKRYFSKEVVTVGEEWILEPHPLKAKLAGIVSTGADWVRKTAPRRS
jgi:hypothetical protein